VSLAGPLSRFTEAEREKLMTTTKEQEILDIIKETGFFPETLKEKAQKA